MDRYTHAIFHTHTTSTASGSKSRHIEKSDECQETTRYETHTLDTLPPTHAWSDYY